MKHAIIAAALALGACTGSQVVSPGQVATATKLDEQAGLSITLAYQAANRLGLLAIRSGVARGDTALRIKMLDAQAFGWVQRVRVAYEAGDAASYAEAVVHARGIIAEITKLAS